MRNPDVSLIWMCFAILNQWYGSESAAFILTPSPVLSSRHFNAIFLQNGFTAMQLIHSQINGASMSAENRIKELEETVLRLKIETDVLRELMIKQVALNNIAYKGKYDEVIIQMAKEYEERGLDVERNRAMHEAMRQYIKDDVASAD